MDNGSNVFELFLALGLIIGAAQLGGAGARAIGQPRVFGKLMVGVILGPSLLNFYNWPLFSHPDQLSHTIHELAELGVLLLMFTVGLEVHLRELLAVKNVAVAAGTLGAVLPVALAIPTTLLIDESLETAVFVGVVLSATSVSISAQTLLEIGVLRTKEGFGLLATAVVDDILAILMLSITLAVLGAKGDSSILDLLWILIRMALYLMGALLLAWFVLPRVINWLSQHRYFEPRLNAFALMAALFFGWSAEYLGGVAAITGAFIAGMGMTRVHERVRHEIGSAVHHISYAFLMPIFFVNVGLLTNLREIGLEMLPFAGLLLLATIVAKIVGSGIGAKLGGFHTGESLRLGVCMISRGEVGLIIASLGLSTGILSDKLFQPVFLVILLTTVITPPLVRWVFRHHGESRVSLSVEQAEG